jgi:glycosyltransferase involved in cell wall biosynthesis
VKRQLAPIENRDPLRVMFAITVMPVGGAETLLANLIRRMDRSRFSPELCCLKSLGTLGEQVARDVPAHHGLIAPRCKYDARVLPRLVSLLRRSQVDAVVTVGAGDTMFWTRLAAWWARVPVVVSAIHSTGWPDPVGRLNRLLTPLTDAFIAVAREHGRFLVDETRFPKKKVHVIANGVDADRFQPSASRRARTRGQLGVSDDTPVCGIVAALRPEKNHELFLAAAARVCRQRPDAQFWIVGDGDEKEKLQRITRQTGLSQNVRFLGSRPDVPHLLAGMDIFSLTSHNEANPVSILEAMAVGVPVVATRVGSVAESVTSGLTGYLVDPGNVDDLAQHWLSLFDDRTRSRQLGAAGREAVCKNWSLASMVQGYQDLIGDVYTRKVAASRTGEASCAGRRTALDSHRRDPRQRVEYPDCDAPLPLS